MRQNIEAKNKVNKIIKAVGILIVTAGLVWLIALSFGGNNNSVYNLNNTGPSDVVPDINSDINSGHQNNLLMQHQILQRYLNGLQSLDQACVSLLTDTTNKYAFAGMSERIASREASFGKAIDSVSRQKPPALSLAEENLYVEMINSFRQALESRRSLNNTIMAIAREKGRLSPDQQSMLHIQNELSAKEKQITSLQAMLQDADSPLKNAAGFSNEPANQTRDNIAAKDNQIAELTAANFTLQKEYDRLTKQLNETGKKNDGNNGLLKNKPNSLENQVEELSIELQLAQVDCNLARADASQIISNSKQRKVLLSEAYTILKGLSRFSNKNLQTKIQEKTSRLNQVATNYRD